MKIGDRVRVVGPDGGDSNEFLGTEFEITEAWKNGGVMKFSAIGVPFFPESSLELVEEEKPKLSFSYCPDTTEIERAIGVAKEQLYRLSFIETSEEVNDRLAAIEKRLDALEQHDIDSAIRISRLESGKAAENPEPELMMGDWVEITGNPVVVGSKDIGLIAIIDHQLIAADGPGYHVHGWWYRASSLRKLSDEEIARRLNG